MVVVGVVKGGGQCGGCFNLVGGYSGLRTESEWRGGESFRRGRLTQCYS